jgi:hypothetical protein
MLKTYFIVFKGKLVSKSNRLKNLVLLQVLRLENPRHVTRFWGSNLLKLKGKSSPYIYCVTNVTTHLILYIWEIFYSLICLRFNFLIFLLAFVRRPVTL